MVLLPSNGNPKIDVVYPVAGQVLKENSHHFIYGNVQPPHSKFTINGKRVSLYKNGAFMAYLPVQKGDFVFHCKATADGYTAKYEVPIYVDHTPEIPRDTFMIDYDSVKPEHPLIITAGDELKVSIRATPGCKVSIKIDDTNDWFPLAPGKVHPDFYSTNLLLVDDIKISAANGGLVNTFEIDKMNPIKNRLIKLRIENPKGNVIIHSFGNISIITEPMAQLIELTNELTTVRTTGRNQHDLFLPAGIQFRVTGRKGKYWRVAFGKTFGWINEGNFKWLESNIQRHVQEIDKIHFEELEGLTRIRIPLSHKMPFLVEQNRNQKKIKLNIWDVKAGKGIEFTNSTILVDKISWENKTDDQLILNFKLNLKQQWGYFAYYQDNDLLLELKHPPKSESVEAPLMGKLIMLDAGHHPDEGAIGPSRLEEREVNWKITNILKKLLEESGATVLLTRSEEQGMTVPGRLKLINFVQPDVVISIHNNSLPDGFDPYRKRGTVTYYYHQQSYPLASLIQSNLIKDIKLPSQGVRFANLALCRPTGMPTVLVEAAFMVLPKQEYLLRTQKFQNKIANSLYKSLKQFFKKNQSTLSMAND